MQLTFHFFNTIQENWHPVTEGGFLDSLKSLFYWRNQREAIPQEFNGCALMMVVGDTRPESAAKLSAFDREHVDAIVCDREGARFTNYSAHVLRLIKKADPYQRELLRMIYPDHVEALLKWERGEVKAEVHHGG